MDFGLCHVPMGEFREFRNVRLRIKLHEPRTRDAEADRFGMGGKRQRSARTQTNGAEMSWRWLRCELLLEQEFLGYEPKIVRRTKTIYLKSESGWVVRRVTLCFFLSCSPREALSFALWR